MERGGKKGTQSHHHHHHARPVCEVFHHHHHHHGDDLYLAQTIKSTDIGWILLKGFSESLCCPFELTIAQVDLPQECQIDGRVECDGLGEAMCCFLYAQKGREGRKAKSMRQRHTGTGKRSKSIVVSFSSSSSSLSPSSSSSSLVSCLPLLLLLLHGVVTLQ